MSDTDHDTTTVDEVERHRATPNRDLYFMTAVMATGFSTVSAVIATIWAGSAMVLPFAFLPVAVFLFASRDYYGAAFPSLNRIRSARGEQDAE